MWSDESLEELSKLTALVERDICKDFIDGNVVNEEDFSSALMRDLRSRFNKLTLTPQPTSTLTPFPRTQPSYTLDARVLTSKFKQSEENLSGADIMMGYRGSVDGQIVDKAVLVQAKLFDGRGKYRSLPDNQEDKEKLHKQCQRMKLVTSGSAYVFVYSRIGIRFYSADVVISNYPNGLNYNDGLRFIDFMRQFFECSLGDHELDYLVKGDLIPHLRGLGIRHGFLVDLVED